MYLYITMIAEINVNIIKKCNTMHLSASCLTVTVKIHKCKWWSIMGVLQKNIYLYSYEKLSWCSDAPESDPGKCISCKPKTEKCFSNEDSDSFTKLSSHLKPKPSETEEVQGKCCERNYSVHPIWCPFRVWIWYQCFTHNTWISSKLC